MCAWKILTSVYRSQGLAYYDGAGRKRFATQWSAERDRPIPGGGSCACRCPGPEGVPRGMALSRRRRHPHRVRGSSQGPGERRMTMSGGAGLSDLVLLSDARTFSISAENRDGRSGGGVRATRGDHSTAWASRELPVGWKKSPCIDLEGRSRRTVADIEGPGEIGRASCRERVWVALEA